MLLEICSNLFKEGCLFFWSTDFTYNYYFLYIKAYELSATTGSQVLVLVAGETGHIYSFMTHKFQPLVGSDCGKDLIQKCLSVPDKPQTSSRGASVPAVDSNAVVVRSNEPRLNQCFFEDPDLLPYAVEDDKGSQNFQLVCLSDGY